MKSPKQPSLFATRLKKEPALFETSIELLDSLRLKLGQIMKRKSEVHLKNWLYSSYRKPLVVQGARQVGKTWLVRNLAQTEHKTLIELNFERDPSAKTLFQSNEPARIIKSIGAYLGKEIDSKKSILFLDEIQEAEEILAKLRWFAEELPELSVIAAGSLLEFLLEQHEFSMPLQKT